MSNFLKKHDILEALFPFSGKQAPNLVDPLVQACLQKNKKHKCSTVFFDR